MIKKNLKTLLLSSFIVLLPMVVGLFLYPSLPAEIATHFNSDGVADGWSSRAFAVFAMPLILLGAHLLCVFICSADPKYENITGKALLLVFWILPAVSVFVMSSIYAAALGLKFGMGVIIDLMVGILFAIIGNYMPKCRQNYTVGIKVPWALNDEDNWNYTHRVGGWCYMLGGIAICVMAFLRFQKGVFAVILLCALAPVAASYLYYLRHPKNSE